MNTNIYSLTVATESMHELAMKRLRRRGFALLLLGLGGFLAWSATMPIDEALAGSGVVGVASQRKAVQPAFAGVLASLDVKEGDRVRAGQVLMRLDVRVQEAELASVQRQWVLAQGSHQRLSALLMGARSLRFDPQLQAQAQSWGALDILSEQQALFASQRDEAAGERLQYELQAQQMQTEASKLSRQRVQQEAQRELAEGQVDRLRELVKMGFYAPIRLADTERTLGDARINETRVAGDAVRSRQQIQSLGAEREHRDAERRSAWASERLAQAQAQVQLQARMTALKTSLAQAEVQAPVTGTVVGLNIHGAGAVVQSAQTLMEIVPADDALLVDTRFPLASGEKLVQGMDADLMMQTLDRATTPILHGKVQTVSADRVVDERTGEPYLRVQIGVPPLEQARLAAEGINLRPGLQAQAHVKLGERTLLGHLIKPMRDRLARAFTS